MCRLTIQIYGHCLAITRYGSRICLALNHCCTISGNLLSHTHSKIKQIPLVGMRGHHCEALYRSQAGSHLLEHDYMSEFHVLALVLRTTSSLGVHL